MKSRLALLFIVASACDFRPCSPGQELSGGFCFPASGGSGGSPSAAETAGAPGVETPADAGVDAMTECSPSSQFGDPCTVETDCHCPMNYCAIPPGQTQGSCTVTGCLEDPSICPPGLQCLNLAAYGPGLPSICAPPM